MVRRLATALALSLPLYAFLTACGTAPIPRVAVEGTTVAIAIPGKFEVGYGRATFGTSIDPAAIAQGAFSGPPLNAGNLTNEDLQRGELVARLVDNTGAPVATLPVRYVTRVAADPASALGRGVSGQPSAQTLLWVDIPLTRSDNITPLVSDSTGQQQFGIEVRRFRRSSLNQGDTQFVEIRQSYFTSVSDWIGWGWDNSNTYDPTVPIPIDIRDAVGQDGSTEVAHFTPFTGWDATTVCCGVYFWGVVGLPNLNVSLAVPDPEFRIQLAPPSGTSLPGAWVVDLTYPAQKMVITGVTMIRGSQGPGNGFVSYKTLEQGGSPSCPSGPAPRTLHVSVVDADALASGVKIAYALKSDVVNCGTGASRVNSSDFSPSSLSQPIAYNLNGAPVTIPASIVMSDFN